MLTESEITARRSRIGASDIASILGMPTFRGRNAYSTWLDKCGLLEPEKRVSAAITAGNRLEPVVLDHAEGLYGPLERNVVVADPKGGPIASTLDGRVKADGVPVEAKTSGIEGPLHGEWGEALTDQVPDAYLIQCQAQLLCTGAGECHLVALLGGRGFVEFRIEPQTQIIGTIRNVAADFFERYIVARRDPRGDWADRLATAHGVTVLSDPCEPVLETVKRYRRVPKKVTSINDIETVTGWQEARQQRIAAEKIEAAKMAAVLAQLGDAEAAELPNGMMLTYYQQGAADTIDRDRMKADGIYTTYASPNTCRVARLTKGR